MSDLRALIREILTTELHHLQADVSTPDCREELVSISNNAELSNFVQRLLNIGQDSVLRADIQSGRHVFKLTPTAAMSTSTISVDGGQAGASRSHQVAPARVDSGLITEKQVADLPPGTTTLSIGKTVRFTPLARDELRRRGIRPERNKS